METTIYKLFKGFNKIGDFATILEAKKEAQKLNDGQYNLISSDRTYRSSWQVLNGVYFGD